MESTIDRTFRKHGEDFFGKTYMSRVSSAEVEVARCWTMRELARLTEAFGKQEEGTVEHLFCNCLFGRLWEEEDDLKEAYEERVKAERRTENR